MNLLIKKRLEIAQEMADLAGDIIRAYFRRSHLESQTKLGETSAIVTLADQEAEQVMVDHLLKNFPDDGVIREEGENKSSASGYNWVIDPIDGTSSFVKGLPIFGTLIALVDRQKIPVFGIADQPILRERWLGIQGQPSQFNTQVLSNRYAQENHWTLNDVCLTSTTPLMFVSERQKAIAQKLQTLCKRTAFGGDCYNYLALAAGWTAIPLVILEADLKYYDFCALMPIIEGSGGVITDWSGAALTENSTEVLATASPYLHQLFLKTIDNS